MNKTVIYFDSASFTDQNGQPLSQSFLEAFDSINFQLVDGDENPAAFQGVSIRAMTPQDWTDMGYMEPYPPNSSYGCVVEVDESAMPSDGSSPSGEQVWVKGIVTNKRNATFTQLMQLILLY